MITKFKKPVAASGSTIENEPIIKSDGASSDVMQWLSNDESSNVTISEDDSNNLDLVVSAGNVGLGVAPAVQLHQSVAAGNITEHRLQAATVYTKVLADDASGFSAIDFSHDLRLKEAGTEVVRISAGVVSVYATDGGTESTTLETNAAGHTLFGNNTANRDMNYTVTGTGGHYLSAGGSNRLSISSAGNVGIGKSSADYLVEIEKANGDHTSTALAITNIQNGGYGSALNFVSKRTDAGNVVAARIRTQGGDSWNTDASTDSSLFFSTVENNVLTDRLTISSTGDVTVQTDQNAGTIFKVKNATDGTAADAELRCESSGSLGLITALAPSYTTSNAYVADSFLVLAASTCSGGLGLAAEGANEINLWTNNAKRVTVSSAGLVTVTKAGSAEFRVTNSSESKTLMLVSGTAASTAYVSTLTSGEDLRLQANGGLTTAVGGIVEEGGVLKENLLTNSGFDVWSNSTLEVVDEMLANDSINSDGSATTGWNVYGGATLAGNQDGGTSGGHDGSACITATGDGASADNGMYSNAFDLEKGKLYKVTVWVKGDAGGSAWKMVINDNAGAGTWIGLGNVASTVNLTTSWAQYTWYGGTYEMAEATTTTARLYLLQIGDASGVISFDDIKVEEVTPGIVTGTAGPDGWAKTANNDIYRQHDDSTFTKDGSFYSLKITKDTTTNRNVRWPLDAIATQAAHYKRFAGRTVTFGAWVYGTVADNFRLRVYTSAGSSYSDYHSGVAGWEWLEVTRAIATGVTEVSFLLEGASSTATTNYVSQVMLSLGSAIGSGNYSKPSGEIVWFEKQVDSNKYEALTGQSDEAMTTLNLEADSNGAIPKGAKAAMLYTFIKDSGSAGGDTYLRARADSTAGNLYVNDATGKANDAQSRLGGWQSCDSSGDIQVQMEATGSGTLDIDGFEYKGVQLR